jgi:hypothetical protein
LCIPSINVILNDFSASAAAPEKLTNDQKAPRTLFSLEEALVRHAQRHPPVKTPVAVAAVSYAAAAAADRWRRDRISPPPLKLHRSCLLLAFMCINIHGDAYMYTGISW